MFRSSTRPIVIVGTGPTGTCVARELARRVPDCPVVMFGDEPWEPYDRVRLSSLLAGEIRARDLASIQPGEGIANLTLHWNRPVVEIDRTARMVKDGTGRYHEYSSLVLATGSHPVIPNIIGIDLPGVFTFRNLDDAQRLLARQARTRRTVVLGGGLLGMEAAKAMQRFNTEVWVVERGDRLLGQQLDREAAGFLGEYARAQGIHVELRSTLVGIEGKGKVEAVWLDDGRIIRCDTVIIAVGIRPNVELAWSAGITVKRGIVIDDETRSSDPNVHAVGECAEHRGVVYGLVAPGFEQATVAAHNLAGGRARYVGSVLNTRLKVLGMDVYSLGDAVTTRAEDRAYVWQSRERNIYRKLVVRRGRCAGVISIGTWPALPRVQDFVNQRRRVWRRHIECFTKTGFIWSPQGQPEVVHWPASAIVCNCTGVTRGELGAAYSAGCRSVQELAQLTRASTVCGSCKPLLAELVGTQGRVEATRGHRVLFGVSGVTLLWLLAALLGPSVPYAQSFDVAWRWDELWRNSLFKQVSGYTALALSVLGLVMSLRKRVPKFQLGGFPWWRLSHVFLGLGALAVLAIHTGGRLGYNLNFWLMLSFTGLLLTGAAVGTATALEHRLHPATAKRWRGRTTWLHILLFWPLPVLLGFHVLKIYYF